MAGEVVKRTYLQMTDPAQLTPALADAAGLVLTQVIDCPSSFYRYLYAAVGERYRWFDRRGWTDDEIRRHLSQPLVTLFVLYSRGSPAGYFELVGAGDRSIEIAYFGLLPEFHGRGWGKHLLSLATQTAWARGATRVWLHTCTLDDPAALPNYLRRGFRPYRDETYVVEPSGRL